MTFDDKYQSLIAQLSHRVTPAIIPSKHLICSRLRKSKNRETPMTEGNLQKRQLIFQLQPAVCTFSDLSRLTLFHEKNEKVQNPTEMTWTIFYCSNRPMPDAFALQGVWVKKMAQLNVLIFSSSQ